MSKPYSWPSREEWAAKAEYSVRTACYLHERVSPNPLHWITSEELAEARSLVVEIQRAARRELNRAIRPLLAEFADQPTGGGYYDWHDALTAERRARYDAFQSLRSHRTQLNASARESARDWVDVQGLAFAWGRIGAAAERVGAAPGMVKRLGEIGARMVTARDEAAQSDLEAAIAKRVSDRDSDEGWSRELKRREEIDTGRHITVTRI